MDKLRKILLLLLAGLCLTGSGFMQGWMNRDRDRLGLTRMTPLENAPPMLAFTTVALGGFRGLISNALWIRANELQEEGKFFEMAQLADWITKLEPGFPQVWTMQAWNMAYNISVKFKDNPPGDFSDRWRWVQRGIELIRDEGLRYNPNEPLLYSELSWLFFHKMGDNLDDGNMFYKQKWAEEMAAVLGDTNRPNFDLLIHPQTDEDRARVGVLTNRYKLDPALMKEVNEEYGPLEWRLPEAHAIYWAVRGRKQAEADPQRFDRTDLDRLRRSIYQALMRSFHRGRLLSYGEGKLLRFAPNLDIVDTVNKATLALMKEEDVKIRDGIATAHRNFLADAVYYLYTYNRIQEAQKWYDTLAREYPDKPLLSGKPDSLPRDMDLAEYCFARVQEDIGETDQRRVGALVKGLITSSFLDLAIDNDEKAAGLMALAKATIDRYQQQTSQDSTTNRIPLAPFDVMRQQALDDLLNPQEGLIPEARARLRDKLNLPPEPAQPAPADTNAPPVINPPASAPATS
ncbi:MAG: hypothetical protein MUC91_11210 [Verrucomicrobia bacterium]|nr:hypothetical protein [Verrucomicrobiota bacterium]